MRIQKMTQNKEANIFFLFGATGDLARRKLYPALYNLYKKQQPFAVIGLARRPHNHQTFRDLVKDSIQDFVAQDTDLTDFLDAFYYHPLDVNNLEAFVSLKTLSDEVDQKFQLQGNRVFYLSLAPRLFGQVTSNLKEAGLTHDNGWKRLIIEKPFGHDLESGTELNESLHAVFKESEIYRIDHYLGKEMIQNIQVIRFANPIFESVWNNRYISNIQITLSEQLGVGERASYYDQTGALLDMIQNHMLQLVSLTAMEPPSRFATEDIRDEKVKVLKSLRLFNSQEVKEHVVRGQYIEGTMPNGESVIGYKKEENIDPESKTETYVAARLFIDNYRWAGVPFYIRTGKRLAERSAQITVQFKDVPKNPYFYNFNELSSNLLTIHIQPDEGISLKLNAKQYSQENDTIPVKMEFCNNCSGNPNVATAYERLIEDCINGDSTNFIRWDEVAFSWTFVDAIAKAWREENVSLEAYTAGSMGPKAADDLLAKEGFHWWDISKVDKN